MQLIEREVGTAKTLKRAERIMRETETFPGQRVVIRDGIAPGTFAVVLMDGAVADTSTPITFRGGRGAEQGIRDTSEVGGARHFRRATTACRTFA